MKNYEFDKIVVTPRDIDLSYSPLRKQIREETYVLGAFNPGMARLPNGNLILMVRVAEALRQPVWSEAFHSIRWDADDGYALDAYPLTDVDTSDPRKIVIKTFAPIIVLALTSLSWILPIEINAANGKIIKTHYDKIIAPERGYQEYGIEDARISLIEGQYYMTTCGVSSERHSTVLYRSKDGLNYTLEGIILDHQNKDMLLFEGKINNRYYALTRPLGSAFFAPAPKGGFGPGPSINLAVSPDLLHWKPVDEPFLRPWQDGQNLLKLGGGSQPVLTPLGWLMLFHSVEEKEEVGIYKTYWALLDKDNPAKILRLEMKEALLEARPSLTEDLEDLIYLRDVVFTTGVVASEAYYIVASGELDLCCRITHIPKTAFSIHNL